MHRHVIRLFLTIITISRLKAADPSGVDFFETKIRPVLAEKCYGCHSVEAEGRKKLKGGLYLDSKEGVLTGGKDGIVLIPGDAEKSRLIQAIRYGDEESAMPPKEKLSAAVIADFTAWVAMGAPDPRVGDKAPKAGAAISEKAKSHWAFQPLMAPTIPSVQKTTWAMTDIDRFILAKLEAAKIAPANMADKRTWLRRATFDLIGLPPTSDEIAAFEVDQTPSAFVTVIDRLLATPAYGERWGRHWLDVARYADSKGYVFEEDRAYPHAYTYRDWVIKAFNDDLPYDRFLQLQIAADRIAPEDKPQLAALGFLTVGRRFINNIHDIIDDRLDVLGRGTMGLSIACARCHDHKFDPIPTKDYYALYGVYASSEEPSELPIIGAGSDPTQTAAYEKEKAKRQQAVDDFRASRFAERIKELRSADQLATYLRAGQEAVGKNDSELSEITALRRLEKSITKRWRDFLGKVDDKNPVLGPWKLLAGIPDGEFALKAKERLAHLDHTVVNPLIVAALAGKEPANREELAKLYATVLAANDAEAMHSDANKEALRQILRADGSPTAVPFDKANDVLNGDDEKKERELRKNVIELDSQHAGAPARAMVLNDRKNPHNVKVFVRGQESNQGDEAPRRFLTFLTAKETKPFSEGSGRAELARAIAAKDNPLTARVFVNRVWAWHFGTGLVRTPSDFGLRTEAPLHRDLLDWLAARFITDGWSLKKMHRLIMLSSVYRQTAEISAEAKRLDPDNSLWSRANRLRLDFESMRDALLAVSGQLDQTYGGKAVDLTKTPFTGRRTVYGSIDRQNLPGVFRSFDFASPDAHTPQRFYTTVPQQALFLMNSPFSVEQAKALAKRSEMVTSPEGRIQALYRFAFARSPTKDEIKWGADFVRKIDALPVEAERIPVWSYGNGRLNLQSRTLTVFTPLPQFINHAWQGGDKLPDKKLGWSLLNADGGHPGGTHDLTVVRRFTAPSDGAFRISGTLKHPSKDGDGVRGLIIANHQQALGDWVVKTSELNTVIEHVVLKQGQTLDFIVDCQANENSDRFSWAPVVSLIDGKGTWDAYTGFSGPVEKGQQLSAWERYAQALLMTNEFVFVD